MMFKYRLNQWAAIIATCLTIFIANANLIAVNLAFPAIMKELHTPSTLIQWVSSIYMIGAGMFMILGGQLSSIYGARKIFVLSLIIWLVSLFDSGMANSSGMLIFARLLSGIAFALSLPASMEILTNTLPKNRKLVVAISTTNIGLAQVLSPIIGGCLLQYLNWRWVFFINIPLIVIALLNTLFFIKGSSSKKNKKLQLDFSLLCNRDFLHINMLRISFQFVYFSLKFVLPMYLINSFGMTPINVGVMILYISGTFVGCSPFIGKLSEFIAENTLIIFSFLLMTISFIILCTVDIGTHKFILMFALIAVGIAAALMFHCSTSIALYSSPPEKEGIASGLFFTNALIGGALGVATSSLIIRAYMSHTSVPMGSDMGHTVFFNVMFLCTMISALSFLAALSQRSRQNPLFGQDNP